jgi:hypothetical protein
MQPKIDIVYTWVNDSDNEFVKQLNQYATSEGDQNPQRYRDIYETLKYSLRSVEKYATWVNKIHIVVQRPQKPTWLNIDHPKIQLVYHDQFIDHKFLPTYNPRVIQSFFHLIPNSSDYMIYMNDDYFFNNTVNIDDFIKPDLRMKVYGSIVGIPLKFRVYAQKNQLMGLPRLEHSPFIIYKKFWIEMLNLMPNELFETRNSRFRKADNLRVDRLYRYFLLSQKREKIEIVNAFKLLKISVFNRITDDVDAQRLALEKIRKTRPKFLCLNDNQSNEPNVEVVNLIGGFLDELFPTASDFELL